MSDNDLREAVARALWCANEDEKTFDEALRSEIDGDKQDANALRYVREMADAAIAVVVERCAAVCDKNAQLFRALADRLASNSQHDMAELSRVRAEQSEGTAEQIRTLAREEEQ